MNKKKRLKKINRLNLLNFMVLCLFLISQNLWAEKVSHVSLDQFRENADSWSMRFPRKQTLTGKSSGISKLDDHQFYLEIIQTESNTLSFSNHYHARSVYSKLDDRLELQSYRADMNLKKIAEASDEGLADLIKSDSIRFYRVKDLFFFRYFKGDNFQFQKRIAYADNTIDIDHLFLYLQGILLLNYRENFKANVFFNSAGIQNEVLFEYGYARNGGEIKQDFEMNPELKQYLNQAGAFHYYIFKPLGKLGWSTDIQYIYLFDDKYPYQFKAFWGGENEISEWAYITDIRIN